MSRGNGEVKETEELRKRVRNVTECEKLFLAKSSVSRSTSRGCVICEDCWGTEEEENSRKEKARKTKEISKPVKRFQVPRSFSSVKIDRREIKSFAGLFYAETTTENIDSVSKVPDSE